MTMRLARFIAATNGHGAVAGFALVFILGLWLVQPANGGDVSTALATVLILQMFTAASGFNACARHGYYDPFLAAGTSRHRLALMHLIASVAPGCLCWCALAGVERIVHPSGIVTACRPGALVALAVVSAVGWAISLPWPRFGGGVLWMIAIFGMLASRTGVVRLREATILGHAATLQDALVSACFVILFPFSLLDASPVAQSVGVLLIAGAIALGTVAIGIAYVSWRDYSLAGGPS